MKFPKQEEGPSGWSPWQRPTHIYQLACCDCALVHTLEFTTDNDGSPMFRVKRNEKETKRQRKKEGINLK